MLNNNWRQQLKGVLKYTPQGKEKFIQTEIIEKIIDEIPDTRSLTSLDAYLVLSGLKDKLKNKWLGKE